MLGAYVFAFFPWGVMGNIDFITDKWRTIRLTRQLARIHIVSSVLPMVYVAAYAEAQRRANDSKEYGAALAAVCFNLIHLVRTNTGVIQVNAFVGWCKEIMEWMNALRGVDEGTKVPKENKNQTDHVWASEESEFGSARI